MSLKISFIISLVVLRFFSLTSMFYNFIPLCVVRACCYFSCLVARLLQLKKTRSLKFYPQFSKYCLSLILFICNSYWMFVRSSHFILHVSNLLRFFWPLCVTFWMISLYPTSNSLSSFQLCLIILCNLSIKCFFPPVIICFVSEISNWFFYHIDTFYIVSCFCHKVFIP